ncbi:hypothetical protein LJC00_01365 [Dysgonomonas sp. OttesenSCG-928-M03]|nr:hypothetical protein [Dysgonomonas sp. OttesenSCG-928-M03]
MKNYKTFLTQKNETWEDAISRFQYFRKADMKDYFSNKEYSYHFADNKAYTYYQSDKVSAQCISDFIAKYNVNIPQDLINLLCHHGPFRIGDSLLEIYDDIGIDTIVTLSQVLSIYGYGDFINQISPGMLKSLNGFYFFFGVSFPHSKEPGFLYFNKAGNFGKMLFAPNNHALVLQKILPSMFNGSIDKYTLDSLISTQIDRVIINALAVRGYID